MRFFALLVVVTFYLVAGTLCLQGQQYRIAATVTITNAPTTNGQSITVNSSTRRWTNNPAISPSVWIQTNATKNGSATNLFTHVATYRFSSSINSLMTDTNAIKIQGAVGGSLVVTVAGGWASVTMSTQLVSTPFTPIVRVPLDVETPTNATNIASMLFDGQNRLSTNRAFNSLISTNATLINARITSTNAALTNATLINVYITSTNAALTNAVLQSPSILGAVLVTTNTLATNFITYASSSNSVALTVNAAALQSNDIVQVKNSSGAVLAAVLANGSIVNSNVTASRVARWNANKQLTNAADVYRQVFVPAGAMITNITEGALGATEETGSNDRMFDYMSFDGTITNGVQFVFAMPREWDVGTLKAKVFWSSTNAGANQTVVWEIAAGAVSDDDAIDAAFGTAQTVSDDVTAANDLMLTSATSAITVGGTPAAEDLVWFRIRRLPGHASDDLGGLAKLLGVWIQYGESATEVSSW